MPWWGLRSDAPYEGLTNFLNGIELSFLSYGQFGFYPTVDTLPGCLACIGKLEVPESKQPGDATVRRHFYIGFPDLQNTLDFAIGIHYSPPYYQAPLNNCVMAVREAAVAAGGLSVPTTAWPQYFGWAIQLMYWHEEKIYSRLILP